MVASVVRQCLSDLHRIKGSGITRSLSLATMQLQHFLQVWQYESCFLVYLRFDFPVARPPASVAVFPSPASLPGRN
jgi:hypothetical protein